MPWLSLVDVLFNDIQTTDNISLLAERRGQWLALLFHIWDFPGSRLGPETGYSDFGFS
jgi:hypothetical protein